MSVDFASPLWLLALWGVPVLAGAAVWSALRARRALTRFVEARLAPLVAPGASVGRRIVKRGAVVASVALVIVALARPRWGVEERDLPRRGRDVVFLIDVSRSMLSEDVRPNRLERAKLWVDDAIRGMPTNRVAIVAFAGSAVVKCPLTLDHAFARLTLSELSPASVARGGTNLGDALRRTAREVLELSDGAPPEARTRDIVLISDGGDQESLPAEAAAQLGALGVRIIALGVGDPDEAHPIPIDTASGRAYVEFEGKRVMTRLESGVLRETALASAGGVYLPVGGGAIELAEVYADLSREDPRTEFAGGEGQHRRERFQWFLLPAIALLVGEAAVGERSRKGARR